MKPHRILVIGALGYLGSRLTDFLLERGYDCTGADIGFFRHGVLYEPRECPMLRKEARTIGADDLKPFDVVIQLAGISNDPFGDLDPATIYDPTRAYSRHIASMCKQLGIRFIFPSSCSVYGVAQGPIDEQGATNPQTPYSLNKLQVEQDLAAMSDETFAPIALRLATVFGASPRIRFDVVTNMLCGMAVTTNQIILNSDGSAWRPHVDIEDVCEAFRCCIDWEPHGGGLRIFNIGRNDNNVRIRDLAQVIVSLVPGCELSFLTTAGASAGNDLVADRKIHDGVDSRTYQVTFDKAHAALPGFSARWSMADGAARLLADLRRLRLDPGKFRQRDFYRLQQLDHLHRTGQLSSDLRWSHDAPVKAADA